MLTTRLFIADSLLKPRPYPPISNLDDNFGCLQSFLSQTMHREREPPPVAPNIFANTYYPTSLSKRVSTSIVSRTSVWRACWRFRRTYKTFEKTAHRNVFHNMVHQGPPFPHLRGPKRFSPRYFSYYSPSVPKLFSYPPFSYQRYTPPSPSHTFYMQSMSLKHGTPQPPWFEFPTKRTSAKAPT